MNGPTKMHSASFSPEEIEWFATCGIDVVRRQRLEEIAARQRARNPFRWLWRQLKTVWHFR